MIYFIIYICTILVLVYADAMVCIATKHEFKFLTTLLTCIFFPITIPIFVWFASKETKGMRDAKEMINDLEKE